MSVLCVCPISSIHTKYSFYIFIHTANASAIDTENIHTCRIKKKQSKLFGKRRELWSRSHTYSYTDKLNNSFHFTRNCLYIYFVYTYNIWSRARPNYKYIYFRIVCRPFCSIKANKTPNGQRNLSPFTSNTQNSLWIFSKLSFLTVKFGVAFCYKYCVHSSMMLKRI